MNDIGDRTLLLAQWVSDLTEVTVGEVMDFADYAGWTVSEVARRLREVGVRILLDQALRRRPVPPSRHAWILEAIHEKLRKDKRTA